MTSKTLKSGTIIQIKLNHNLGFIFAKVVNMCDFAEYDLSNTLHLIIYPYNYIIKKEEEYNEENLLKADPLTGPLFVIDILWAISKKIYNIKGELELRKYEKIIPAFRSFTSPVFKAVYFEDEATNWSYFEGGAPRKYFNSSYEQVMHLEGNTAHSCEGIEKRLSMEILYRSGKIIKDYYELQEWKDLKIYNNILYKTPFNLVPDELKGVVKKS